MTSSVVDALLAAPTPAAAVKLARTMNVSPADAMNQLRACSERWVHDLPARSALASSLAETFAALVGIQPWAPDESIAPEANELIHAASLHADWPGALITLLRGRESLSEEVYQPVMSWHTQLARLGLDARANGLTVVLALGVVLGGPSLGWSHLLYARHSERQSPSRALTHFVRATIIMDQYGSSLEKTFASEVLESFLLANGLGDIENRVSRDLRNEERPWWAVPAQESRAHDLREAGQLMEALELLDESIETAHRFDLAENEMRMLNLRGLVNDDLGALGVAEADYRRSAEVGHRLKDESREREARTNLAANFLKQERYGQAIAAFSRLLREADAGDNVAQRIAARNNLATAQDFAGKYGAARQLYSEALAIMHDGPQGAYAKGSLRIALTGLSSSLMSLGLQAESRSVATELLNGWYETGDLEDLVAYVSSSGRDYSNDDTRDLATRLLEAFLEAGDIMQSSALATGLANYHEAVGETAAALRVLDLVLDLFPSVRSAAPNLTALEHKAAKLETKLARPDQAVRRLRDAIDRVEDRLAAIDDPTQGDWILAAARPLYLDLMSMLLEGGEDGDIREAFDLHDACRPMTLTSTRGERRLPGDKPVEWARRTAGWADVASVVREADDVRMAVVSFVENGEAIGAFVVTAESNRTIYVPLDVTRAELSSATLEFSALVNGKQDGIPQRLTAEKLMASRLGAFEHAMRRLGRVVESVGDAEVVCFVPTTSLESLPLHAITDEFGDHLIQRMGVFYQPSVSALVRTAASPLPASPTRALAVGVAALEDRNRDHIEDDSHIFDSLGAAVITLRGKDATPSAVRAALTETDVAHITCHGFVDTHDPLGSALLLSDGQTRPSRRRHAVPILERGRFELTVRQLMDESFQCDLLTLRACSTARRAVVAANDEVSTLLRVFQLGGCRTVVSALWNVNQRTSLQLLRRFYAEYFASSAPPAWDAMATSMRAMLREGGASSHVYHWAPFIVSGDWRKRRND